MLGKDHAIFPLAIPALVSVPAGFLLAYVGTLIGAGRVGSTGMPYEDFERRAFAPEDEPREGGRFTRRAEAPERVGDG